MIALEFDTFINPAKLFGLNLIFEAMNDAVRADMIHRLYGFSHADFLALTAMHDIFSVELATSLTPEVTKKKQALRTLQAPRHRRQPGDDSLQPPLVSIIVPCFNDGVYLAEAMSSIFSQTYKPIETIIVNDGSTDKETKRILSTASWPCTTIVNSANRGPAAARNTGIAAARGKYILPLDADDRIAPSYVERAVAVLESREEVGIVYCHADFFGRKRGRWHLPPYSIEQILLDNVIFATALFRKDDWKAVNGYDEELRQGMEDYDFWLSLIEMGREVVQLPEVLFHYRITGRSRTNKFLEKKASVYETYQRIYRNHPRLYSEYHELSTTVLRNALIDHILWKKLFDSTLGRYPAIFNAIKHILSRSKSILHKVFNETSV
jgi:glycosyltransferase involved in cell wall biosynthesis